MRTFAFSVVAALGLVGLPAAAPAQPHIRETIVVTGSASPVLFENLGRSVTVLTREQIVRLPGRSVADMLRFALGVDVRSRGPSGVQSDFSIRGAGFGQTLVLVDGIRLNDAQSGHHNSDIPVPIEEVERIEIIYGPGSSVYGADAFGGTINVITRRGSAGQSVTGAAGQFGLLEGAYRLSGGAQTPHSIALDAARSSGFTTARDFGVLTTLARTKVGETLLQFGHTRKEFGANGFYGPSPSREWTDQTMMVAEQPLLQQTRWRANAAFSYRTHGDRFLWDERQPGVFENRHRTHAALAGIKLRGPVAKDTVLTAGGDVGGDWIGSSNLGDRRFARVGIFAELQRSLGTRASLHPGLRFDSYSTFGSAWSPSLSASVWVAPSVRLRGSIGRAFRIPTFTELYYTDPAHQAAGELRPESAWGGDGGADWLIGRSWLVSGAVFARRENNVIDWVRETATVKWRSTNLRNVNTRGVELEAKRFIGQFGTVSVRYSGLVTDAEPIPLISKYVLDYPRHSWAVAASTDLPWQMGLGHRLVWTDRSNGRRYLIADVRLSRRLRGLELFGEATNLFDETYQEIAGVDMPGRWVRFGIKVNR